ncbi:MAG: sulfotransferase, partial [Merismopedia sp. SIO2A8]|nr:sulfotransferase [Merismopedia sp. SIO2A8]
MVAQYQKIFVVGCPRSGTTWLAHMIKLHPDVIAAWSESHAYPLIYDPFTYVSMLNFSQRLNASRWVLRQYGIQSLLTGITPDDIWHGIKRSYRAYQRSGDVGLHFFLTYDELQTLMQK